jgi:hypothetical protein
MAVAGGPSHSSYAISQRDLVQLRTIERELSYAPLVPVNENRYYCMITSTAFFSPAATVKVLE